LIQRILTALVLIPLVLLLILRAPIWLLAIVAGIVALLAIREFLELTRRYGVEPFTVGTYVFVGIFFFILSVIPPRYGITPVAATLAALSPFIFLSGGLSRQKLGSTYPAAAASAFAFAYIAIPIGMLIALRQSFRGELNLVFLMIVVWSGDILAYFVGKSLGRYKMASHVSPKKTWEGAAASLLASIICGTLLYNSWAIISRGLYNFHIIPQPLWWAYLPKSAIWKIVLLSAILNVAAQLGDLVESAIKRGADVKDSGSILPGHGGMLDRIDAMLFAAPVLWFFVASGILP
jgi:phosphatidate cytidylyltransferase